MNNVTLLTPISSLIANKRRVSALKKLGVVSVGDALTYYPFRVTEPVPVRSVREARIGEPMAFAGVVRVSRVIPMGRSAGFRLEASVDDSAFAAGRHVAPSDIRLTFFSHKKPYMDWMGNRLRSGAQVVVAGVLDTFNGQLQFTHPEVLTVAPNQEGASSGRSNGSGTSAQEAGVDGANAPSGVQAAGSAGRVFPAYQSSVAMRGLRFDANSEAEALRHVCRPRPVYHANSRISSDHIHESILTVLAALGVPLTNYGEAANGVGTATNSPSSGVERDSNTVNGEDPAGGVAPSVSSAIPDILPASEIERLHLPHRAEAFAAIHNPQSVEQFKRGLQALRYEEAYVSQTAVLQARQTSRKADSIVCGKTGLRDRFIDSLPFSLTAGQRAVVNTIGEDMQRDYPMQRLLQGEVGSGKTVVALAAMLQAVGSGGQAVLVAPTQVLAEQHLHTITGMAGKLDEANGRVGDVERGDGAKNGNANARSKSAPIPVTLLTGGMKLAERRRALAQLASGEPGIVIATHAAFSKKVQMPNLALAVIDEQHRFGVEQRQVLKNMNTLNADGKPIEGGKTPHLLVMTATPIPRSAAMTWFGDLEISELTELPGGRKPIKTVVVPEADSRTMAQMFVHLRRRVDAGERAYIVCPRIETDEEAALDAADVESGAGAVGKVSGKATDAIADSMRGLGGAGRMSAVRVGNAAVRSSVSGGRLVRGRHGGSAADDAESGFVEFTDEGLNEDETSGGETAEKPPLHAVSEIAARLSSLPQFRGIAFATLTGRDDDETKQRVMADFQSGKTPVLVATTVIEVGVDVPEASCIVIFDADRFGLSQLHQLRGRVGRGGTDAWAFLVSRAEPGSIAEQRLDVIRRSTDGAEIAEADLELRGAGDVTGDAQSGGKSGLKLLRVVKDKKLIAQARESAESLLAANPTLDGEPELAGAVLDFTRGSETQIFSS